MDTTDFPKRCACGRVYARSEWGRLRLVGHQDDGEGGLLELRDCTCKSTLAVQVTESQLASCQRCGNVEELRVWRGLSVCEDCDWALTLWAASAESGAREYLVRVQRARRVA